MNIYLAGPIVGLTYADTTDWRVTAHKALYPKMRTFSPMRGKGYLNLPGTVSNTHTGLPLSTPEGINTRDFNDVKRADALLVNFLGATTVSIGTVMEIAWASALRIPVICIMESNNIHQHIMLNHACGFIVSTLYEGIETVIKVLGDDAMVARYEAEQQEVEPTTTGNDFDIDKVEPETFKEALGDKILADLFKQIQEEEIYLKKQLKEKKVKKTDKTLADFLRDLEEKRKVQEEKGFNEKLNEDFKKLFAQSPYKYPDYTGVKNPVQYTSTTGPFPNFFESIFSS